MEKTKNSLSVGTIGQAQQGQQQTEKKNAFMAVLKAILAFFTKIFRWIGSKLGIKTQNEEEQKNTLKQSVSGGQKQVQTQAQTQTQTRRFSLFGGRGGGEAEEPQQQQQQPEKIIVKTPTQAENLLEAVKRAGPTISEKAAQMHRVAEYPNGAEDISDIVSARPIVQRQASAADAAKSLAEAMTQQGQRSQQQQRQQPEPPVEDMPPWMREEPPACTYDDMLPPIEDQQEVHAQQQRQTRHHTRRM